jgi:hypothetical protein
MKNHIESQIEAAQGKSRINLSKEKRNLTRANLAPPVLQKNINVNQAQIDSFEKSGENEKAVIQTEGTAAVNPEIAQTKNGLLDKNYNMKNAKMQLRDILNHYFNTLSSFIGKNGGSEGRSGSLTDFKEGLQWEGDALYYGAAYMGEDLGLHSTPNSQQNINQQLQQIDEQWNQRSSRDLALGCKNLQWETGNAVKPYTKHSNSYWTARNIRLTPIDWQSSPVQHNAVLLIQKGKTINQGLVLDPWKNQSPEVIPYKQWVKEFPKLSYVWVSPKGNLNPGINYHLYSGNTETEAKSFLFYPIQLEARALQYY